MADQRHYYTTKNYIFFVLQEIVYTLISPCCQQHSSDLTRVYLITILCPVVPLRYPNLKSVRELIYKRGHGRMRKQRIALTDNALVEKALGMQNILLY